MGQWSIWPISTLFFFLCLVTDCDRIRVRYDVPSYDFDHPNKNIISNGFIVLTNLLFDTLNTKLLIIIAKQEGWMKCIDFLIIIIFCLVIYGLILEFNCPQVSASKIWITTIQKDMNQFYYCYFFILTMFCSILSLEVVYKLA